MEPSTTPPVVNSTKLVFQLMDLINKTNPSDFNSPKINQQLRDSVSLSANKTFVSLAQSVHGARLLCQALVKGVASDACDEICESISREACKLAAHKCGSWVVKSVYKYLVTVKEDQKAVIKFIDDTIFSKTLSQNITNTFRLSVWDALSEFTPRRKGRTTQLLTSNHEMNCFISALLLPNIPPFTPEEIIVDQSEDGFSPHYNKDTPISTFNCIYGRNSKLSTLYNKPRINLLGPFIINCSDVWGGFQPASMSFLENSLKHASEILDNICRKKLLYKPLAQRLLHCFLRLLCCTKLHAADQTFRVQAIEEEHLKRVSELEQLQETIESGIQTELPPNDDEDIINSTEETNEGINKPDETIDSNEDVKETENSTKDFNSTQQSVNELSSRKILEHIVDEPEFDKMTILRSPYEGMETELLMAIDDSLPALLRSRQGTECANYLVHFLNEDQIFSVSRQIQNALNEAVRNSVTLPFLLNLLSTNANPKKLYKLIIKPILQNVKKTEDDILALLLEDEAQNGSILCSTKKLATPQKRQLGEVSPDHTDVVEESKNEAQKNKKAKSQKSPDTQAAINIRKFTAIISSPSDKLINRALAPSDRWYLKLSTDYKAAFLNLHQYLTKDDMQLCVRLAGVIE